MPQRSSKVPSCRPTPLLPSARKDGAQAHEVIFLAMVHEASVPCVASAGCERVHVRGCRGQPL